MGDSNDNNIISITGSNSVINGSLIAIPSTIISTNGYESNLSSNIQIGYTTSSDPLGPDEYGYYIYDENDSNYQWFPDYDWIEIDPDYGGDGIELSIYDVIKGCEQFQDYKNVRLGIDWFQRFNADAYMILLD